MTIRRRILLGYICTLLFSLSIVWLWGWFEFNEQRNLVLNDMGREGSPLEDPLEESFEIIFYGGVPALVIGVLLGTLLIRQVLRPIEDLTEVLEQTNATNLSDLVPRSGNGDELDRMSAVFNDMKGRLEVSLTQAREFTLHASHELKTPLTIMHSTLEQMLQDKITPAAHSERIASMLEELQRLSSIVGQLTFLAKADARQLTFEHQPVQLDELVRDVTEDAIMLAASADIRVTLERCEALTVNGDRQRLRQVLLSLVDNSVKHNHQHGRVSLALRKHAGRAVFQIKNTGTALAPEMRSRVFERFFRGDAAHGNEVEGSGLGLSIAESIAQAHGGTLVMEATPEGLIGVTLDLPLLGR
jgi:signal transduction histidine kinase